MLSHNPHSLAIHSVHPFPFQASAGLARVSHGLGALMLMSGRAGEALAHHSRALERRQDRLESMAAAAPGLGPGPRLRQGEASASAPGLGPGPGLAQGLGPAPVVEDVEAVFLQLDRLEVKLEVALSLMSVGQCHVALGNIRKVGKATLSYPNLP